MLDFVGSEIPMSATAIMYTFEGRRAQQNGTRNKMFRLLLVCDLGLIVRTTARAEARDRSRVACSGGA